MNFQAVFESAVAVGLLVGCSRSPSAPEAAPSGTAPAKDVVPDGAVNEDFPPGLVVDLQPTADCVQPEVEPKCGSDMCRIPGGCFIQGAPRNEYAAGRYSDVQVQVTLTRSFEIGRYEVTNKQWLDEGFQLPTRDVDVGNCTDMNCPISNVNLFEVITFLNKYSEARGLKPCYELRNCKGTFGNGPVCNREGARPGILKCEKEEDDGISCDGLHVTADSVYDCEGYRLPTESEWEYAARAGTGGAFWTGDITPEPVLGECAPDANLEPIAWYCHIQANGSILLVSVAA